jgi:hypothetical protein
MAYRDELNPEIAKCISIDEIKIASASGEEGSASIQPYQCTADGSTVCQYVKRN